MELIEWLRAQFDDDERTARAAHQSNFRWYAEDKGVVTVWDEDDQEYARWRPANTWADAEHIVRWDPARVLAEVKAKRAVLDRLEAEPHEVNGDDTWFTCHAYADPDHTDLWSPRREEFDLTCVCGRDERVETYVRLLAQPYAGRAGWRDEWSVGE